MGASLTLQILEAHRAKPHRSPAGSDGREDWELRVDHVAFEAGAGVLVFAAFETLGIPRVRTELALACLGRGGTHPGFEHTDDVHRLVSAARRYGAHLSRSGNGRCDPVYRDRYGGPGKLLLTAGEASPSSGALGMLSLAGGELETAAALGGVPLHLLRPTLIVMRVRGSLASWVGGQDLALEIARLLPGSKTPNTVLEIVGPGVRGLSMADRIAVASQCGALGAAAVVFPSDEITRGYLRAHGREADWKPLETAAVADAAELEFDLDTIEPLIAARETPEAARPVRQAKGMDVRPVVLGTQATFADLALAARVLAGRRTHSGVELVIVPGSRALLETVAASGVLDTLVAAGARVLEGERTPGPGSASALAGVGLCFGATAGCLGGGRTAWYVTSPGTCAASALAGRLTDPRELDADFERHEEPDLYATAERWILKPLSVEEAGSAAVVVERNAFRRGRPLAGPLRGAVLLKLGERVAGEWILPWGARMQPHVAEIASLAQHAFASLDCEFPASAWRQGGGFVVAGREFGMAPHREQAALVLVELGVRAVLARSFDRGFLRRLAQAGVLPLRLRLESDYHALAAGDELEIPGLPETLEPGKPLVVRNLTRASQHTLPHDLGAREIELIRAGGLLALAQIEAAAADGARA